MGMAQTLFHFFYSGMCGFIATVHGALTAIKVFPEYCDGSIAIVLVGLGW